MLSTILKSLCLLLLIYSVLGATGSPWHASNCADNRVAIVHLFEWKWTDIAAECERFLGPRGFCGVQVSPPMEHVLVTTDAMRPWWERYQPVSYKLTSRSGTEAQFIDMVQRCNQANVRIYVDAVINHMAGLGRSGKGSAGSTFDSDNYDFPAVPFSVSDFHSSEDCSSGSGNIESYNDPVQVRNCKLLGLVDLDQSKEDVRNKIVGYYNNVIDIGVAGFRVDAAKHMWANEIEMIQNAVNDLNTNYFPANSKPFFYHEVIDMNNEPTGGADYAHLGRVTEFRYCSKIYEKIQYNSIADLMYVYDPGWNMLPPEDAFVFVDNHDNQRGHGASGTVLTHKDPDRYKRGVAFTLANTYGYPRMMSSYDFVTDADGPPHNGDYSTKDVTINADGSCGNGWMCEHRWHEIAAMAGFAKAASGQPVANQWSIGNNLAFSRGNKAFFAITGESGLNTQIYTGLPAGQYCDVISGCPNSVSCDGQTVTVDGSGNAQVVINGLYPGMFAIHVEAMSGSGECAGSSPGTPGGSTVSVTQPSGTTNAAGTTTTTTPPTGTQRTVIFLRKETQDGQDIFIRGGFDHSRRPGCSDFLPSDCAVSISPNQLGSTPHYDKHNAWRTGDTALDWYGRESSQGFYNDPMFGTLYAEGTPSAWTSSSTSSPGYQSLNSWGDHYWMVDVNMDCSETENGWFELKGYLKQASSSSYDQWESDVTQGTCTGTAGGSAPYTSSNHMARCGFVNKFDWGSGACEINNF